MGNKGTKSLTKEQGERYQKEFGVSKAEIKKLCDSPFGSFFFFFFFLILFFCFLCSHKVWTGYAKKGDDQSSMDLDGFQKFCKDIGSDDGNVPMIFEFIDASHDGLIQFDEWIVFVMRVKNPSYEDYAQLVIDLYDEDGSGTVSVDEVRKLALSKAKIEGVLTPERTAEIEEVVKAIFAFADKNKDGELTKEELIEASKKDPNFAHAL
jgi:Ca2+-binding EF-hand superfamily protein